MCIRDSLGEAIIDGGEHLRERRRRCPARRRLGETRGAAQVARVGDVREQDAGVLGPVSYTHLRAHETVLDLVCRLLLEKKKEKKREEIIGVKQEKGWRERRKGTHERKGQEERVKEEGNKDTKGDTSKAEKKE